MFKKRAIYFSLPLSIALTVSYSSFLEGGAVEATPAPVPSQVPLEEPPSLTFNDLQLLGKEYRANPNTETWQKFIDSFKKHLAEPHVSKVSADQFIKANPSLSDLRAKVINAGGTRIWYFPNMTKNQTLYLQNGQSVNALSYPDNINLSDARMIKSLVTTTKTVRVRKGRRGTSVQKKVVSASGPSYLVLAGTNRIDGKIWLSAFKPYENNWVVTNTPFPMCLPPS